MKEKLQGDGLLEDWANPVESYRVSFTFEITTSPSGSRGEGAVVREDKGILTEGIYRLAMRDGTTCKVKKHSGIWTILSS